MTLGATSARGDGDGSQLRPWTGDPKPNFALRTVSGDDLDLATLLGRAVVVHFFATWCEPCREELPALHRLVDRGSKDRLTVVAISVAEVPVRVKRFVEQTPVNFPVLLDEDRAVAKAWGVHTLPTTFVLDAALAPRLAIERDFDWDRLDFNAMLEQLTLGQAPDATTKGHRTISVQQGG